MMAKRSLDDSTLKMDSAQGSLEEYNGDIGSTGEVQRKSQEYNK